MIMTVGELRKILENYKEHDKLPVKFFSCESGGFWPRGRGALVVGTDHQISLLSTIDPKTHRPLPCEYLRIDLLKE